MQAARRDGDTLSLVAVWLGIVAVVAFVGGLAAHLPNLAGAGVVAGLVAIVLARLTRSRAREADDDGKAHLGRIGQLMGWIAAGPFVVLCVGTVAMVVVLVLLLEVLH
jgi:hypothetical protein